MNIWRNSGYMGSLQVYKAIMYTDGSTECLSVKTIAGDLTD
jgi:hypothetical protein